MCRRKDCPDPRRRNPDIVVLRPLGAGGIDLAGVEAPALVGIAEQVVGARHLLEFLLSRLVAGIEVGMQLLRQLAIGALNLGSGGRRGDAEDLVRISHGLLR